LKGIVKPTHEFSCFPPSPPLPAADRSRIEFKLEFNLDSQTPPGATEFEFEFKPISETGSWPILKNNEHPKARAMSALFLLETKCVEWKRK